MAQSYVVALRSTCTRLNVGAVIVRDNRIIASGYNGSIVDSAHCIDHGCYIIDGHCVRTVHAEANAILQCARFGVSTEKTDLYVTHFPCLQCCKMIIQSGINRVFYANDYKNHRYAVELFHEAGVFTEKVQLDYLTIDPNYKEKELFVKQLIETLGESNSVKDVKNLKMKAKELFE